jgi:hypothetical protein
MNGFTVEEDSAFIRREQSNDMFEKHAFSRTALADERRDMTFLNLEIDPIKYRLFTESFRNISEFNQCRFLSLFYMIKEVTT